MSNEEAHRLARERGVSRWLYALVRDIASPLFRLYFRMHISGAEHIPREGPAIVAPNHKSFWDSFFIGVCTRRHVRFMAKTELIQARYGRLLVRLGAFPVRRGQADEDALETARIILRQGGLLALFPEGTRIRDPDNLGHPRRGAGRLALETAAPLVPCAITGTEKIFRGGFPVPRRVQGGLLTAGRGLRAGPLTRGGLRADRGDGVAGGGGLVPAAARAADGDRGRAGGARSRRRSAGSPQAAPLGPAKH
jgi:1-acyl-sn-glycerol-3-phosphate acyltransferase